MNHEELPPPDPTPSLRIEGWKRTVLLAAAAVGSGVLARWILAPWPYPLGLRPLGWRALEFKLSPMVMGHLTGTAPWIAAAGLAAVLMPRRKWLWAVGCAVGAALAYHISGGTILRLVLPSMSDLDVGSDDPVERLLALEGMFKGYESFAPSWEMVLIGVACEMPFAIVSGPAGAALALAGTKLKDARQATQLAVGASAVVVIASAALVLQWIDRPPCRADGADPGPIVELRLMHDPPRDQSGIVVCLSPGPRYEDVPTLLDPSETVKMQFKNRDGSPGVEIMVHDRPGLVISGTDIVGAEAGFSSGYAVRLRLTSDGLRKQEDFTRRNVGRRVAVLAYGRLLSAPTIAEPISGPIYLSVGRKKEDAMALAARINGLEPPATDAE